MTPWRCLLLKQFPVNRKDKLPKKLQMSPKRNQPAAVLISTITPYKTYKTRACVMSNQYFSCEQRTNALQSWVILKISLISFIISLLVSCIIDNISRQITRSECWLREERILSYSVTDKGLRTAANILTECSASQKSLKEYQLTKGYFPVIHWSYIWLSGLNPSVQILRQFFRCCGQNLSLNNVQVNMK